MTAKVQTAQTLPAEPADLQLARQRLRLWLQMLKAVRHVENDLREKLRANYDTTLPRFDVLAALHSAPDGLKMGDLSQQLMVSNGNVTGIIDRLVKEGLVARNPVETDRRAFLIKITPKGAALMEEMADAHLAWIDDLFDTVSEPDVARGIAIMLDLRQKHGS